MTPRANSGSPKFRTDVKPELHFIGGFAVHLGRYSMRDERLMVRIDQSAVQFIPHNPKFPESGDFCMVNRLFYRVVCRAKGEVSRAAREVRGAYSGRWAARHRCDASTAKSTRRIHRVCYGEVYDARAGFLQYRAHGRFAIHLIPPDLRKGLTMRLRMVAVIF